MSNLIFSFQGSFGPPTLGHLMSMLCFAEQIDKDFCDYKKTMLFMPAAGGSKTHLFPTRASRFHVLRIFCEILKPFYPNITFGVSDIEYNIAGADNNKSVATIHTIRELNKLKTSADDKICLGMGLDNAYQLPYWESIDEYVQYLDKIYVVHRDPTPAEIENIGLFDVLNANGTCAKLYFDTRVPSWAKKPMSPTSCCPLPTIVTIHDESIPPTSSSMMRYFIGLGDKEKVKTIMFGPFVDDPADAVDETMRGFVNHIVKDVASACSNNELSYEDQYTNLLRFLSF